MRSPGLLPSPDEVRRALHRASTLLARVGEPSEDGLALLGHARRSIAAALAGVERLLDATPEKETLIPVPDPDSIEVDP